jgi:cell division protein FtsI (penicillin-binding protein 3)
MSNIPRHKLGRFNRHRSQKIEPRQTALSSRKSQIGSSQPGRDPFATRLTRLSLIIGLGTLGLLARLVWLQVLEAPRLQSKAQIQQSTIVHPFVPRRTIVDRSNQQIVAIDRPSYTLDARPSKFTKEVSGAKTPKKTGGNPKKITVKVPPAEVAAKLASILAPESAAATLKERDRLIQLFARHPTTAVRLGTKLGEDVKDRVGELKVDGLDLTSEGSEYTRFYPQNDLLSSVLGFIDRNRVAGAGVELSKASLLERQMKEYQVTQTRKGENLPDRFTPEVFKTDDLKLRLTIDLPLQRAAKQALKTQMLEWNALRGTIVVMDAETGAVRALAVDPPYDPNHVGRDVEEYREKLVARDRGKPQIKDDPDKAKAANSLLRNWAVEDLYEPGSTFKPINVAIALENKVITPQSTFVDEGSIRIDKESTISNPRKKPHGTIDVAQVLQVSSNVGMAKMMLRLKPSIYYDWLQRINLGQKSGIDIVHEEVRGAVRSREDFIATRRDPPTTAIGQGFSLTPIQLTTLICSLANGGKLVTPYVVEGVFDNAGVRTDKDLRPKPIQIFSPKTAKTVLEMMETVVTKGSGSKAQIPGYRIAGKTGTAEQAGRGGSGYKREITSFVGILPVDREHRYVVFAAFDDPKNKGAEKAFGFNVAAPAVKYMMEAIIAIDGIPPSSPIPSVDAGEINLDLPNP